VQEVAQRPTPEQEAVIGSQGRIIAVSAFAGTGKTTSLVHFVRARPTERTLYLAFSKAIQLDAAGRFPSNVTCRTTHAIAYRKAAALFGDAVREKVGSTWPSVIARRLEVPNLTAAAALETLQAWFASADEAIGEEHVPDSYRERMGAAGAILDTARRIFTRMLDRDDREVRAPHDLYLKLFALDRPALRNFDRICVDESQDISAATLQIVLAQDHASLVFVGDQHQSIFGFRKSVNAMALVNADARPALTTSFRFGNGISAVANRLLGHFKAESLRIKGVGPQSSSPLKLETSKPIAVIARTNAAVFDEAVNRLGEREPYAFVGGVDSYRLERVMDAHYLSKGQHGRMKDPYLRSFGSMAELELIAEAMDDPELKRLVKVTEAYGNAIPNLVDRIQAKSTAVTKENWASFNGTVFSTAHKSKGLEFDQVHLTDDYVDFFDRDGNPLTPGAIDLEEVNIVYVALTRARRAVRPYASLTKWLSGPNGAPA